MSTDNAKTHASGSPFTRVWKLVKGNKLTIFLMSAIVVLALLVALRVITIPLSIIGLLVGFLVWLVPPRFLRYAWPELILLLLLLLLGPPFVRSLRSSLGWLSLPSEVTRTTAPMSSPATGTPLPNLLPILVTDLTGGAGSSRRNDWVTLMVVPKVGDTTELVVTPFSNLRVHELLSDTGNPVGITADPPRSLLLDVPTERYAALSKAWQTKHSAYLLPQLAKYTPTPTGAVQAPTPTPLGGTVIFELHSSKIITGLAGLAPGHKVSVFLFVNRTDADGTPVSETPVAYPATVIGPVPASGMPYDEPLRIALERGNDETAVVVFARDLPLSRAILVLPEYPPLTETPTSTPPITATSTS